MYAVVTDVRDRFFPGKCRPTGSKFHHRAKTPLPRLRSACANFVPSVIKCYVFSVFIFLVSRQRTLPASVSIYLLNCENYK